MNRIDLQIYNKEGVSLLVVWGSYTEALFYGNKMRQRKVDSERNEGQEIVKERGHFSPKCKPN